MEPYCAHCSRRPCTPATTGPDTRGGTEGLITRKNSATLYQPTAGEAGVCVLSTPAKILACDLTLHPGEAAIFHYSETIPAAGLTEDHVSSLQALVAPFSTSEFLNFLQAFINADFPDADLAMLEETSKTAVDYLGNAEKVLMKIDMNNLPAIVSNLDELGIELTDFITNPGIFFDFLNNPI